MYICNTITETKLIVQSNPFAMNTKQKIYTNQQVTKTPDTSGSHLAQLIHNYISIKPRFSSFTLRLALIQPDRWMCIKTCHIPNNCFPATLCLLPDQKEVWISFTDSDDGVPLTLQVTDAPFITRLYVLHLLTQHLQQMELITGDNFVKGVTAWKKGELNSHTRCVPVSRFLIHAGKMHNGGFRLTVAYEGKSLALVQNVSQLASNPSFDALMLKQVIFEKKIYSFKFLPSEGAYHHEKVYPIVSQKLAAHLGLALPYEMNKRKLTTTYNLLESFAQQYLRNEAFESLFESNGSWAQVRASDVFALNRGSVPLVFGESGTHTDILNGFKQNGPFRLPDPTQITVFMIFHEESTEVARVLYRYLFNQKGFFKVAQTTRLNLTFEQSLNIVFHDKTNAADEIEKALATKNLQAGRRYYAFYVSPWDKFEPNEQFRRVYFRVKEVMLQRGVALQVVNHHKIMAKGFQYSIANIAIAMVAKLGGVPWRLATEQKNDLIVGFGAFRSENYRTPYVGASFCFNNLGVFNEFDCFPADEVWNLAGSVRQAIERYTKSHAAFRRLIIHFYKEISYTELKPIEDMLDRLNYKVPVVVVRISKTLSEFRLAFDPANRLMLPRQGTYVRIGHNDYLLFVNQCTETNREPVSAPLPVRLTLKSNDAEVLADDALVRELMQQVYEFSHMYWRSVTQPPLPVTVAYPELLARIFPWFEKQSLPVFGKEALWFL